MDVPQGTAPPHEDTPPLHATAQFHSECPVAHWMYHTELQPQSPLDNKAGKNRTIWVPESEYNLIIKEEESYLIVFYPVFISNWFGDAP